ncbi:hypothetical protein PMIN06_003606 [Paraphaeosphaeria minitans]
MSCARTFAIPPLQELQPDALDFSARMEILVLHILLVRNMVAARPTSASIYGCCDNTSIGAAPATALRIQGDRSRRSPRVDITVLPYGFIERRFGTRSTRCGTICERVS